MKNFPPQPHQKLYLFVVLTLTILAVFGLLRWSPWESRDAIIGQSLHTFPELAASDLTPEQTQLVEVLEQEFSHPQDPTVYSEGNDESWCADFVSWAMRKAHTPLTNPHSGSWRIPGVYTLQEYYESVGRFQQPSSHYQPITGDVVLYSPQSNFGQHTNIILSNNAGLVVTIGGNENGKIKLHKFELATEPEIVGFGLINRKS